MKNSSSSTTSPDLYQHFKEDQIPSLLHQHTNYSSDHFRIRRNGTGGTSTTAAIDDTVVVVATQQQQPSVMAPEKRKLLPVIPEDIDQSAEAFIRKFRQQLVIQRMQSIENYEKMLARGT